MFILTRYFSKYEYAQQFLDGKLYMNSLEYFWNNGFEDQRDILEGVVGSVEPQSLYGFENDFLAYQQTDINVVACGYAYCDVCCFSMHNVECLNGAMCRVTSPCNMDKFGSYVVVIKDSQEFINRIWKAAENNNFDFICGPVKYHNEYLNGKPAHREEHNMVLKSEDVFNLLCILV